MITDLARHTIITILTDPRLRKGRWEDVDAEIQDGREFLLVIIKARDYFPGDVPADIRGDIARAVVANLPAPPATYEGNWAVVFTNKDGTVYDTVAHYDL